MKKIMGQDYTVGTGGLRDVMESRETDCTNLKAGPMESCSGGPMLRLARRGLRQLNHDSFRWEIFPGKIGSA